MAKRRNPPRGSGLDAETELLDEAGRGRRSTASTGRTGRKRPEPVTGRNPADPGSAPEPVRRASAAPFDVETELVDSPQGRSARSSAEGKTRPFRPGSDAEAAAPVVSGDDDAMQDPVSGWLVVVDGPGKGQFCRLGYGLNTLGRGENSRVRINFGDNEISRESHATLTYDPRGRKFYLQHGGGLNLTYLGDEPVLSPTPIEALQHIVLGRTTFRFMPLCGPEFDWQDLDD